MIKILNNYLTGFKLLCFYKYLTTKNLLKTNQVIAYFAILFSVLLIVTTNFILFKFGEVSTLENMNMAMTNIMIVVLLLFYFVSSYLTTQHTYNDIAKFLINSGINKTKTNVLLSIFELITKNLFFTFIMCTINFWMLFNKSYNYYGFILFQILVVFLLVILFQAINFYAKIIFKNSYNNFLNIIYIFIGGIYFWKQIWIVTNIYNNTLFFYIVIILLWLIGFLSNINSFYYNQKNNNLVNDVFAKILKNKKLFSWVGINIVTALRLIINKLYTIVLWIYVMVISFNNFLDNNVNKYFFSLIVISLCSENLVLFTTSRIQSIKYHSFKNYYVVNLFNILLANILLIIVPIIILIIKKYLGINEIIEFCFISLNMFYLSLIYPQINSKNKTTLSAIMLLIILFVLIIYILFTFIGDKIKFGFISELVPIFLVMEVIVLIISLPEKFKKYVYSRNK